MALGKHAIVLVNFLWQRESAPLETELKAHDFCSLEFPSTKKKKNCVLWSNCEAIYLG